MNLLIPVRHWIAKTTHGQADCIEGLDLTLEDIAHDLHLSMPEMPAVQRPAELAWQEDAAR